VSTSGLAAPTEADREGHPPEALLDAAFRAFATHGYRATRLDDVAEAAGVTKGAIYYYFDGKEDLLRRTLETRHRAIFAEIEEALAAEQGPVSAKLRFVLRKVWQHWLEPGWGPAFRLMLGEMSVEFPALFRTWAVEGPIHGCGLVSDLIEDGVRRGEFRPDADADVSARLVVSGLMLQAALHVHLGLDALAPCDPDRIFDSAVELFLHGLSVVHRLPDGDATPHEHQGADRCPRRTRRS
jgi:AcrR family transcriptional regulator